MANKQIKKYYIFGAHSRGQTLWVYLRTLYPEWDFLGFLYDNDEVNPDNVDGMPVILLTESAGFDRESTVYIATRGIHHDGIKSKLFEVGFKDVIPVDAELDMDLRNRFVSEYFKEHGRRFCRIEEVLARAEEDCADDVCGKAGRAGNAAAMVYVVRSAVDSLLAKGVPLRSFENYIQAGAALTGERLEDCRFFDNADDNISERNRQMCELTALYWIWKNSTDDVVGLEHYRRRFILPNDWESVFWRGDADVILPVPLYVHPTLKENYCQRHTNEIWTAMEQAMELIHPECAEEVKEFFENTSCYSPCNMLIARKQVFDELCAWLFPVLFAVMDKCGTLDDAYQNRYPGFLAERLMTFFFSHK